MVWWLGFILCWNVRHLSLVTAIKMQLFPKGDSPLSLQGQGRGPEPCTWCVSHTPAHESGFFWISAAHNCLGHIHELSLPPGGNMIHSQKRLTQGELLSKPRCCSPAAQTPQQVGRSAPEKADDAHGFCSSRTCSGSSGKCTKMWMPVLLNFRHCKQRLSSE